MPQFSGAVIMNLLVSQAKKWLIFGVKKLEAIPEQVLNIVQAYSSPDTNDYAADGRGLEE
jgi:hypothetical protein